MPTPTKDIVIWSYLYMEATSIKFTKTHTYHEKYDRAGNGQNKPEWPQGIVTYVLQPRVAVASAPVS